MMIRLARLTVHMVCALIGWQMAMYLSTVNAVIDSDDTLTPRYCANTCTDWKHTQVRAAAATRPGILVPSLNRNALA